MADDRWDLTTYVNDHLAITGAILELVRRCRRSGTGFLAATMAELVSDLERERDEMRRVLDALGGRPDWIKEKGAWVLEKVSRLRPDRALVGHSDLRRLEDVERLIVAVHGKRRLWRLLAARQRYEPALQPFDFLALEAAADRQLEDLEAQWSLAVERAFPAEAKPEGERAAA